MTVLWLCLVLSLVYITALTATNLVAYPKIFAALASGTMKRTSLYLQMMAGLWVPAFAILLLVAFGTFSWSDIGLGWHGFSCPAWLTVVSVVLAGLYFIFLLVQNVVLYRNAKRGIKGTQKIPDRLRAMLPANKEERRMWTLAAITAGIAEELIFRGFLLHVLTALFPALPLVAALLIATLLFGAGHLYQGPGEAVKPLLVGLMFGVFYISFGTILPCILLHTMQDLEANWVIVE